MKSYREEIWVHTKRTIEFVRITDRVREAVRKSGVSEGLCLVNPMHITASVFVNDNESGLWHDFERWTEQLAPHEPISQYRHNLTGEDNADAHLKRTLMGRETTLAITGGDLDLGTWEEVFYGEFDGRRDKRILIKIVEAHTAIPLRPGQEPVEQSARATIHSENEYETAHSSTYAGVDSIPGGVCPGTG